MALLREYHESIGELIFRYEGTLERILANRIMIVFNDPIPCADHTERTVWLALDMRDKVEGLAKEWLARVTFSGSESGSPRATQRSARSGSSIVANTQLMAASSTLHRGS